MYRSYLTILIFGLFSNILFAENKYEISNDELIIKGIFYDEYKAFHNSYKIYENLFERTKEEVFLIRMSAASLISKRNIDSSIIELEKWGKANKFTNEIKRLLIPLYLTKKDVKSAMSYARLLKYSNEAIDLETVANAYIYNKDFNNALNLLEKVYKKAPSEALVLRIATIVDIYTKEYTRAIKIINDFTSKYQSTRKLYDMLLLMYKKIEDLDNVLKTLEILVIKYNAKEYVSNILEIYVYMKDEAGAIEFLKRSKSNNKVLYILYKKNGDYANALNVLEELIKSEPSEGRWLAEKGILLYENASNKDNQDMLQNVVKNFDMAIELGIKDAVYYNYYGYTLIDKDINIKKGINLVKQALDLKPNQSYYLDSLAWGYYKNKECSKAYDIMKKVISTDSGVKEIDEHWVEIQSCQ